MPFNVNREFAFSETYCLYFVTASSASVEPFKPDSPPTQPGFLPSPPPVQVPDQRGRHGGGVPAPVPAGGGQRGDEAGLWLLRALLQRAEALDTLHSCEGRPGRPAGEDPVGQRPRPRGDVLLIFPRDKVFIIMILQTMLLND